VTDEPWRLVVAGPAARHLERLPAKYATTVIETLGTIASNPQRLGKPPRFELTGRWSARRGTYRIISAIDETTRTITVLAIAHRADVYRSI
jgi:mRNA interferase RelE/StbE